MLSLRFWSCRMAVFWLVVLYLGLLLLGEFNTLGLSGHMLSAFSRVVTSAPFFVTPFRNWLFFSGRMCLSSEHCRPWSGHPLSWSLVTPIIPIKGKRIFDNRSLGPKPSKGLSSVPAWPAPTRELQAPSETFHIVDDNQVQSRARLPDEVLFLHRKPHLVQSRRIQKIPFYGGADNNVYFFISVLVGSPPQRQSVIMDTGSSLFGFPCSLCENCSRHLDPPFNVSASSTARWLSCSSPECFSNRCIPGKGSLRTNLSNHCSYSQRYTEGSEVAGIHFSDLVALGEETAHSSVVRYPYVGCHVGETKLFRSQTANGILGLSLARNKPEGTLMDALFKASGVNAQVFSFCSSGMGGLFYIGGYDSSLHVSSLTRPSGALRQLGAEQAFLRDAHHKRPSFSAQSKENLHHAQRLELLSIERRKDGSRFLIEAADAVVPIAWERLSSQATYTIEVSHMKIFFPSNKKDTLMGLQNTWIPFNMACVLDTGSTFSYFSEFLFGQINTTLISVCTADKTQGCQVDKEKGVLDATCFRFTRPEGVTIFPSIIFRLQHGGEVEWRPTSYLFRTGDNAWCTQIDQKDPPQCVLGMSFFKDKEVIFDRTRDFIGIVEANCPSFSMAKRPALTHKFLSLEDNVSSADSAPSLPFHVVSNVSEDVRTPTQAESFIGPEFDVNATNNATHSQFGLGLLSSTSLPSGLVENDAARDSNASTIPLRVYAAGGFVFVLSGALLLYRVYMRRKFNLQNAYTRIERDWNSGMPPPRVPTSLLLGDDMTVDNYAFSVGIDEGIHPVSPPPAEHLDPPASPCSEGNLTLGPPSFVPDLNVAIEMQPTMTGSPSRIGSHGHNLDT